MTAKLSDFALIAALDALTEAGAVGPPEILAGPFAAAAVFLVPMTGPLQVDPPVTVADLTVSAVATYAPKVIPSWSAPTWITANVIGCFATVLEFRPASAAEEIAVTGWALVDALAAGNVLMHEFYADPVTLPDENYAWRRSVCLTLDRNGRWEAGEDVEGL